MIRRDATAFYEDPHTQLEIAKRIAMGGVRALERLQSDVERISMVLQGLVRSVKVTKPRA